MGISDARLYLFAWGNLCVLKWYWRLSHCTQFNKICFSKPESAAGEVRFLFLPISLDFILFFFYFVVLSSMFSAPPSLTGACCVLCVEDGVVAVLFCVQVVNLSHYPRVPVCARTSCRIAVFRWYFLQGMYSPRSRFIHTLLPSLLHTHTHTHLCIPTHTQTFYTGRHRNPHPFYFYQTKSVPITRTVKIRIYFLTLSGFRFIKMWNWRPSKEGQHAWGGEQHTARHTLHTGPSLKQRQRGQWVMFSACAASLTRAPPAARRTKAFFKGVFGSRSGLGGLRRRAERLQRACLGGWGESFHPAAACNCVSSSTYVGHVCDTLALLCWLQDLKPAQTRLSNKTPPKNSCTHSGWL